MRAPRGKPDRIVNRGGRLYAVIDQPRDGARVLEALIASGIPADRVEVLRGDTDPANGGPHPPLLRRLRRALEFTLMDQAPDVAWYEAALKSGRSVVGVRVNREADVRRAVNILRGFGAHFINHFGWFSTEEFERWHGTEPTVPDYLRR